jgi:NADPH:quinone reductase-like Zn-dependent oxidoreductase
MMSWVIAASIMENYITGAWDYLNRDLMPTETLSAFQALVTIAHLKEHENILIHTGASGQCLTQKRM